MVNLASGMDRGHARPTMTMTPRKHGGRVAATLQLIIIYVKQLLDSDRLRAVKFKCNTSANYTS